MKKTTFVVEVFFSFDRPPGEVQLDPDWVKERFKIFHKYTMASLLNQSFDDFRVFVLCGERMRAMTETLEWHERAEAYHVQGEEVSSNPKRMRPASRVVGYDSIDTDYVSITRINSDDMFHKDFMEEIKKSIELYREGSALFMRRYVVWDVMKHFITHKEILSRCSPHYTHVFPKSVYKDWDIFIEQHYINHRFAVSGMSETKEIQGWKACEVRHPFNISDIRRGYIADIAGDKITDKKEMNKIIEGFGVSGYDC